MREFCFHSANILLPKEGFEKWAVIACDQFTSEKEYWEAVEETVGSAPSTLRITLPEIYLGEGDVDARIEKINETMEKYLREGVLEEHPGAMIYVERTQTDGRVRHGVVGAVRLDDYDYRKGATTLIRATEQTVVERIPPRVRIRKDASLELPHVMLLMDDPGFTIIEPLTKEKENFKLAYSFELMQGGGKIEGWFIPPEAQEKLQKTMRAVIAGQEDPMLFAVGDGNHSLATAKECYALSGKKACADALVEIVNIHDEAIEFEPIYRVLFGVNEDEVLKDFLEKVGGDGYKGPDAQTFTVLLKGNVKTVRVKPLAALPVGTLQQCLDGYLKNHPDVKIDYIHGIESLRGLCKTPGTVGFLFDGMTKEQLFPAVEADGSLPRKTFSMGHAKDKRYYVEARKLK